MSARDHQNMEFWETSMENLPLQQGKKKKHREVSTGSMENPGIIDKYCGCEALHRLIGGLSHYL